MGALSRWPASRGPRATSPPRGIRGLLPAMKGEPVSGGFGRTAAMVSWFVPLVGVVGTAGVAALHMPVVMILWSGIASLAILTSAGLGIAALTRIGDEGRRGILVPALVGLGLDAVLIASALIGFASERRVEERAHEREEAARIENEKKATPGSTTDARETIVDGDYRFQLRWPGKGWKLLSAAEAAHMSPLAVAGAMSQEGAVGLVVVELEAGPDLRAYATSVAASVGGAGKRVSPFEALDFHGFAALRFGIDTGVETVPRHFEMVVFLRDGAGFRVATSTRTVQPDVSAAFIDAFTPEPGTVRARTAPVPREASGVGWRLHDGVFESAVFRLAATPRGSFHAVAGPALDGIDTQAEVALVSDTPSVKITFEVERLRDVTPAAYTHKVLADVGRSLGSAPAAVEVRATLGGRKVSLRRFPPGKQPVTEHLLGVVVEGDEAVRVDAWYPLAERDQASAAAIAAIADVRFLDEAEVVAVTRAIGEGRATEGRVGASFSLRSGVYRDFRRGFVWTEPRGGAWRVRVGAEAAALDASALIYFQEPALGLTGALYVEPAAGDGAAYHRGHAKRLLGALAPAEPAAASWGGAPALVSATSFRADGIDHRTELTTAVRGGDGYRLELWGLDGSMLAAPEALEAARAALSFPEGGVVATETIGSRYLDHRLGFAFEPPAGWAFTDATPSDERGVASYVRWASGAASVTVLAVGAGEGSMSMTFLSDILEQRMHDLAPQATAEPGQLAGRACRRLLLGKGADRFDLRLLAAGRVVYGLVIEAPTERTEAIAQGFGLLE
jgi:hypothetical protein